MTAGALRERITIQAEQLVPDGGGGSELTWTDTYSRISAQVAPLSASERLQADQLESAVEYRVTVRRNISVAADDRIVWHHYDGDLILNVRGVYPDKRHRGYKVADVTAGVAV